MDYVERQAEQQLHTVLDAFRVVVLHGARQCGKTTLARAVAAETRRYLHDTRRSGSPCRRS